MKVKPNLFVVGWPKTGSTSLHKYLMQHPDICCVRKKDSYYFCQDLVDASIELHGHNKFNLIRNLDSYEDLYSHFDGEKIVCDNSVFYSISDIAAESIYHYNPKAKIVMILREPISLLQSWYNYLKMHSRENAESLKEAISMDRQGPDNYNAIRPFTTFPVHLEYGKLVQYDQGVKRFLNFFERRNILFITSDDLKSYPNLCLDSLMQFLSIDTDVKFNITECNVSKKTRFKKLKKIVDHDLFIVSKSMKKVLSPEAISRLKWLKNFVFQGGKASVVEKDLAFYSALRSQLLPMLERTSELVNINLVKMWNYDSLYD